MVRRAVSSMASSTALEPTPQESNNQDEPKIILYWLDRSRSHRIVWLLEELRVPYEMRTFSRKPNMFAPSELKEIHPLGKAPILSVSRAGGSDKPVIVAESAVIVEYILDHFGTSLVPKRYKEGADGQPGGETEEWLRYRYYMHYSEGSLMPLMTLALILGRRPSTNIRGRVEANILIELKGPAVPFLVRPLSRAIASRIEEGYLNPNFNTHFKFLEQQLSTSSGEFIAGSNLTGADIMMEFPLAAGKGRTGLNKEQYPKIIEYVERLQERPAYKRAIAKTEEVTGKPFNMKL
jgi:glutathione S-transferase